MVDIWAVIKTFRGEEFAAASLESIYKYCRGIIYVHADTSWTGKTGNSVEAVVRSAPDPDHKIVHLNVCGPTTQTAQYDLAIEFLRKEQITYDYCMLIDTDEVWGEDAWAQVMPVLESNTSCANPIKCIRTKLYDYIKSPFYRIDPPAELFPTVFVHRNAVVPSAFDTRGAGLWKDSTIIYSAYFHHFCSVRKSLDDVWDKHESSCSAENEPTVDRKVWIDTVWNCLPNASNVLPLKNCPGVWKGVKVITKADLPEVLHKHELVRAWEQYPAAAPVVSATNEELVAAGLPAGFGPDHPDWVIPSKRNRYEAWRKGLNQKPKEAAAPVVAPFPSTVNVARPMTPAQKNRLYDGIKNEGSLCITTIVSGAYQWYLPLFMYCIGKELPNANVRIYVRGEIEIPKPWSDVVVAGVLPDYPLDGYTTAALRFIYCDDALSKYDYTLITDCDMLMMRESMDLVDQHMRSLRVHGLRCYDNYISTVSNNRPRVPGVHFVTKDWWRETVHAREKYAAELKEKGSRSWEWDELMLGHIIEESGLPMPPNEQHLWAHHGVHLGDYRRRVANKVPHPGLDAFQCLFVARLIYDKDFMALVAECGAHLPGLVETFNEFKKQV